MGGITGGGGYNGYPGGAGVSLSGGHVANAGTITGGAGYSSPSSPGGVGLSQASGATSNTGLIIGGIGGGYGSGVGEANGAGAGGSGVALGGGTLSNAGTIIGGQGGSGYGAYVTGGAGGVGAAVSGGVLTNTGLIEGGIGGIGQKGFPNNTYAGGGIGGVGVALDSGARLVDSGAIVGGTGSGVQYGGDGGTGAVIDGGTLIVSGTLAGGMGGVGQNSTGNMGDAVQFGALAGTLVVDPGAVFKGDIVANAAGATLKLAAGGDGALTGFGGRIDGLTTISEDARATWTLTGSIGGTGSVSIGTGATLTLYGAVSVPSITFAAGGDGKLVVGDPYQLTSTFGGFGAGDVIDLERLEASSLSYAGGTLTLYNGSEVDKLRFSGSLTKANFALKSDGHYGTDVVFKGSPTEHAGLASGLDTYTSRGEPAADRSELVAPMHLAL